MDRLARQRNQAGKDAQQVRLIKDRNGNIITKEEGVLRSWKKYLEGQKELHCVFVDVEKAYVS